MLNLWVTPAAGVKKIFPISINKTIQNVKKKKNG